MPQGMWFSLRPYALRANGLRGLSPREVRMKTACAPTVNMIDYQKMLQVVIPSEGAKAPESKESRVFKTRIAFGICAATNQLVIRTRARIMRAPKTFGAHIYCATYRVA